MKTNMVKGGVLLIVMIDQNLFVGYDKTGQTTLQVPSEISARGDDKNTEIPEGI